MARQGQPGDHLSIKDSDEGNGKNFFDYLNKVKKRNKEGKGDAKDTDEGQGKDKKQQNTIIQ